MESISSIPFETLEKQWTPLLHKFARWHIPGFTRDDLLQELRIVLLEAKQKYDADKGSFKTFLFRNCLNHMLNLHKFNERKKRVGKEIYISSDYVIVIPAIKDEFEEADIRSTFTFLSPQAQILGNSILNGVSMKNCGLTRTQRKAALIELRETFNR